MADLRLNVIGQDEASVTLDTVAGKVVGISKVLVDFAKSSVKASEEQAKADRQLAAVAGEATDAFKAQAAALQDSLGVSDDHVQQLQTMLLRYGEAPAEIDKTIRAIEDLSAATGRDATAALAELTSSATTGRQAFKDLGLEYQTTGTRGDVLRSATEALTKKFGGTALAEAGSLNGSILKAKQQFGELEEVFGGLISEFVTKTGAVDKLSEALRGVVTLLTGGDAQQQRYKKKFDLLNELERVNESLKGGVAAYTHAATDAATGEIRQGFATFAEVKARAEEIKAELKKIEEEGKKASVLLPKGSADSTSNLKGVAAAKEAHDAKMQAFIEGKREEMQAFLDEVEKHAKAAEKAEEEDRRDRMKAFVQSKQDAVDAIVDKYKAMADATKHAEDEAKKEEEKFEQVGKSLGRAFASALAGEVQKLVAGEEMDFGASLAEVLASSLPQALEMLGSLLPIPGGALIGEMVGTVGAGALRGLARPSGTKRRRHTGGWGGDGLPRYHLGTWVGSDEELAILQTGERVLSRSEVSAMGGPQGVEGAARGGRGGGVTVNVSTFDGSTAQEYFERAGGRALIDALRSGRGAPSLLWGSR